MARVELELIEAGARARARRVVLLHATVQLGRVFGAVVLAQHVGLGEPLRHQQIAGAEVLVAVAGLVVEQRERLLAAPRGHVLARLADHGILERRAARDEEQ